MTTPKHWIVTLCLAAVSAISLALVAFPGMKADRPGIAILLMLVVALALGGRNLWARPSLALIWVALAGAALFPFVVVARGFGRIDMLAILFHLDLGTEGAGLAGLEDEVLVAALVMILLTLAAHFLHVALRPGRLFLPAFAAILVAVNPITLFAVSGVGRVSGPSQLVPRLADPVLLENADRPDLIVVYLEGLELGYSDAALFGAAYTPLGALKPDAITFTQVAQIEGTGWSLGGMVATLCGLPLLPNGLRWRNNYTAQTAFLLSRTCLGDILQARGYARDYVVGGDAGFAGIDHFFRGHGFASQTDLKAMRELYRPEEIEAASQNWIVDDQMVFETAKARYDLLAAGTQPLAIVVETIGPHGRKGYLSRRCSPDGRSGRSTDVAAVVRCTAAEAADFVRHVRGTDRGRTARIVLMSDHLGHNPDLAGLLAGVPRRNTVMFLGFPGPAREVDKPGSMVDIYPTLLEALGWSPATARVGLGVSLLSGGPTLVGEFGLEPLNDMLRFDPQLGAEIWR